MPIFQFQKNRKCHIILPGEVITAKVAKLANLQINQNLIWFGADDNDNNNGITTTRPMSMIMILG